MLSRTVLVVAPHADDETLGCGGTICHHIERGDAVHWLLVTDIPKDRTIGKTSADAREEEISQVALYYAFAKTHRLQFPTAELDALPLTELIGAFSTVFRAVEPEIVYLPFPGDAHSDHATVFRAASACTKWFRYPGLRSVRAYETLSETNFALNPVEKPFTGNLYVNIENYLEKKVAALSIYASEIGKHPFPRSEDAVRALATLRGSEVGVSAAEAFMLLKQIET